MATDPDCDDVLVLLMELPAVHIHVNSRRARRHFGSQMALQV